MRYFIVEQSADRPDGRRERALRCHLESGSRARAAAGQARLRLAPTPRDGPTSQNGLEVEMGPRSHLINPSVARRPPSIRSHRCEISPYRPIWLRSRVSISGRIRAPGSVRVYEMASSAMRQRPGRRLKRVRPGTAALPRSSRELRPSRSSDGGRRSKPGGRAPTG
jgi:hypothetical protein